MTQPRILREGVDAIHEFAFDGAIAVDLYDLMFHDGDDVKPASSLADTGSKANNQREFARKFAGLANQAMLATDAAQSNFPVLNDAVVEIDCTSSTWEKGDLVAIEEAASGDALENQKVTKTTDPTQAVGYCVKREGVAVTRVTVRLVSRVATHGAFPVQPLLTSAGSSTETLTGNKTLTVGDAPIQALDPGGAAREVTLPAASLGLPFWIKNTADAAEDITVKNAGGDTVGTVGQNESGLFVSDGANYFALIGDNA